LAPDAKEVFVEVVNQLREEMEVPGFPARLKGPWSKMEAYLARLSLVLAMVRVVDEGAPERVETRDVLAATLLIDYFKKQARRVYAGLYGQNPDERLAEELGGFLKDQGGRWLGTATGLYEALKDRGSEFLPGNADRLTEKIYAISRRFPVLEAQRGRRRVDGEVRRYLRLTLRNTVHTVHGADVA
jgi:hypothetical protein